MDFKRVVGIFTLVLMILMFVSCKNSSSNISESSEGAKYCMSKSVEGKVYTKNSLHQMIVTGNPKSITTDLTYIHDDAGMKNQTSMSVDASVEFGAWYVGKVILDEDGYISRYKSNPESDDSIDFSYDENGLRTTKYVNNGSVSRRIEDRLDGDYIKEYFVHVSSGEEAFQGKYVKDTNGLIVKKLECYAGRQESYDMAYDYENGNMKKITKSVNGIYHSSIEIEYDTLPVKLTMDNNTESKLVYTFSYEFDIQGNWIKCNKYENDTLLLTYERTIEY